MIVFPHPVTILDVARQAEVVATLIRLDRDVAANLIDGAWWGEIPSKSLREKELDHHWKWRKIVGESRNKIQWDCLAVQSIAGTIEGAISYQINAKSQLETEKGAIYIDRLATAPRNRPWLLNPHKYAGIGTVLLFAAVRVSYSLGLGGRVWLSCLPDARSRDFYSHKGFTMLSEDDDGIIEYELPSTQAEAWLVSEGMLNG